MRILMRSFLWISLLLLMPGLARAGYIKEVKVPTTPTFGDEIVVQLSGTLPDTCVLVGRMRAELGTFTGDLRTISVHADIERLEKDVGCDIRPSSFDEEINFGELPQGKYMVKIYENGQLVASEPMQIYPES